MSAMAAAAASALTVAAAAALGHRLRRPVGQAIGPADAARNPWVPAAVRGCVDATDQPIGAEVAARTYVVAAVIGPLVLGLATGPPLAIAAAGAVAVAPRLALPSLLRRRAARRDDQLAPHLERVASSIRSGRSMRVAIVETARLADRPLCVELEPLADALEHGATLDDALERWAGGPQASAEVRLAAAALRLGARAGGEVARAVDAVASTLRERREVRGETVALATQARMSAGLLVVAPLGFAGLVSTIEPGAIEFLLTTPAGLACLVGGLGLDAVGGLWMQRIVRSAA